MLLRGCPEPATSEERRVREQLKALLEAAAAQQVESSASCQRSERGRAGAPSAHSLNPPPPQQQGQGDGVGAAALAVKSRLGPQRDTRHTIKAHRRAESVGNNNDNCSRRNDDRGWRRCHDSDDDRERSWSPNQQGPRAFDRSSVRRSSPHASEPRPTYRDTTGTPTLTCGSRTTGSRATPVGCR
jgi:hypothetical protein